jgi:hypothetical protein
MYRSSSTSAWSHAHDLHARGAFHQFASSLAKGTIRRTCRTLVYSRLLLEQDNLAIPHIRRIILPANAGVNFKEF